MHIALVESSDWTAMPREMGGISTISVRREISEVIQTLAPESAMDVGG